MLALNRNQVKQMLEEVPITLLTGIPRMKAEMLQAQLAAHQAHAQAIPLD
jgi:4'-phosphopantetheinyl transferase EntD